MADNAETDDAEGAFRELRSALQKARRSVARSKARISAWFDDMTRPLREESIHSAEDAAAYLTHTDHHVRRAAFLLLRERWKPADFTNICKRLAYNDPDPELRRVALTSLGWFYHGSDNAEAGKVLANVVRDTSREVELRKSAYAGLLIFSNRPTQESPIARPEFNFPDDVDWHFVDRFLTSSNAR